MMARSMNASSRSLAACTLACIATTAVVEPSSAYLAPSLKVGERLSSVFSKAAAITGPGFHDVVGRISGTSEDVVTAWEIGPPGTERVRVLRIDALNHEITLTREGRGIGASSDDAHKREISITTNAGKKLHVQITPGEAHWSGYTTVRKGVIIADEILVERHVTLVARTGQKFEGEERSYTLENLASDRS